MPPNPSILPRGALIAAWLALPVLSSGAVAQDGDVAAGERVFNQCRACHQVGDNARNRVGPILNGIVGSPAGAIEGFRYSDVLSGSGLIWDEETLAAYLADPRGFLPGNRMNFVGLRSDDEVADVIAYMASFNADGSRN